MIALPNAARDTAPNDGDRRDMTVDVRDEAGRVLFTTTLSPIARWTR